jgi:integral membrane protein
METNKATLTWFRRVAIAEGISFLVLLLIAMPLKYLAGWPKGVTVVGWAHGVLFVAFLVLAFEVKSLLNKNVAWLVQAFVASVLPLGTFVLEKKMKKNGDFDHPVS